MTYSRRADEKENSMLHPPLPTIIYDAASDVRFQPLPGLFTLLLGLALSVWYVRDIGITISGDVRTFPAAFVEAPVATIVFSVVKMCAYIFFPILFALMVYMPVRNLFFRRVVTGSLFDVQTIDVGGRKRKLLLGVGRHKLVVSDQGDLEAVISRARSLKQELRFTLGAFNRVLRVETIA